MPEFQPAMFGKLTVVPVELVPLYASLAVVHADMSGAPAGICVPVCYQLAGALGYLGFDAEVMAACATVFHRDRQDTKFADVGVWDRPPKVRLDGTTDGHVVLWAGSFRRLVDPTIVQAPELLAAARDDLAFTLPVVLSVASREQLASQSLATVKGPFLITWMLFPEHTGALKPMLGGDIGAALPYGSLVLAHTVLDVLRALGRVRPDLRRLRNLYPQLGALLTGRSQLPGLPDDAPAAFMRIRRAAGK